MAEQRGADLIQRAKEGDGRAFDALLEPLVDPAFRLAMAMLSDRAAAEDVVQEAAFKAWRRLDQFREGSDLRPWFLTIVANQCRSLRRTRWFRVVRQAEVWGADVVSRSAEDAAIDRSELHRALERLPKRHLLPLVLRYRLDLSTAEIADVLGCTPAAAKLRVHRALRAMRPELGLEVVG